MGTNRIRQWVFPLLIPIFVLLALSRVNSVDHSVATQHADIDIHDTESLQNGAKYYVNYCMSCHSLKFSRYNRMAEDIGLNEDAGMNADDVARLLKENLIFTRDEKGKQDSVGALMKNAYSEKAAIEAFGTAIPDLSLVGRSRGADWIYSYLKGFYIDPSRPMGVNNTVFKNTAMPNVLWELQGFQSLEQSNEKSPDNHKSTDHTGVDIEKNPHNQGSKLVITKKGKMSEAEFDKVALDLTNFLAYVGEPAQLSRYTKGIFVLLFLLVFLVLSYALSREYWKDIN